MAIKLDIKDIHAGYGAVRALMGVSLESFFANMASPPQTQKPRARPLSSRAEGVDLGARDQAAAVMAWPTGGGIAGISEGRQLETLAAIFRDRLFEKFRAEQAASYSPDMAANWPVDFNSGGYLMAYTQVKPTDVDRFFAFADSVAADLIANPVSADELQRAVEPTKQAIERAASGNTFWLNQLKGSTYDPERFAALGTLYSDYNSVTPEILQALAKRYFVKDKAWKLVVAPQPANADAASSR